MLPGMGYEYKVVRRVEFSETDMAGIVHFSNFFRYMESAESGFLRSLGFSVNMSGFTSKLGIPRVRAACDFKRPLRFEDQVEIHLLVKEKRTRSITYAFRFHKLTPDGGREEVATGEVTAVCVAVQPDGSMGAVPIPEPLAGAIETAPPELLQPSNPPQASS